MWEGTNQYYKMMLSATPSMIVRSSLEEMLDSIRRREEEAMPKDLPPALPARPASRARLPPARRSLPNNFKVGDARGSASAAAAECLPNGFDCKRKESELGHKRTRSGFGSKKVKKMDLESPYVAASASTDCVASSGKIRELEDDSISYFIKKVTGKPGIRIMTYGSG